MIMATTNIVKYDLTWNVFFGGRKDIIVTTVVITTSQIRWYLATWHAIFGPSAFLYILQRVLAIVLVRLNPAYRVLNQRPYINDKASPEAISVSTKSEVRIPLPLAFGCESEINHVP